MQELILRVNTEIAETNANVFKAQAEQYLQSINTDKFDNDDDFAQAEEDIKALKEVEKRIEDKVNEVLTGNAKIEAIISTVNDVKDSFRASRLLLEKTVKAEKERLKNDAISDGINKVREAYHTDEHFYKPLSVTMPIADAEQRIKDAVKGKRTQDSLTKAVNSVANDIIAELTAELKRLKERYDLIPKDKMHLFQDALHIIIGEDDVSQIVEQRINEEAEREAAKREAIEAQAKADAEAKVKAEQEAQAKTEAAKPEKAQVEEQPAQQETVEHLASDETYKIIINCDLETAKNIARMVKEQYSDAFVALKKGE